MLIGDGPNRFSVILRSVQDHSSKRSAVGQDSVDETVLRAFGTVFRVMQRIVKQTLDHTITVFFALQSVVERCNEIGGKIPYMTAVK